MCSRTYLKDVEGKLSVQIKHEGVPLCMLLDLVEVPKSHTGANLATVFAEVLEAFGIQEKVRYYFKILKEAPLTSMNRFSASLLIMHPTMI